MKNCIIVLFGVLSVERGCFGVCRAVAIWIVEERLERNQNSERIVCREPFRLQDVEANVSISVNIGMKHLGLKLNLRWRGGVVVREFEFQHKRAALPSRSSWSVNHRGPFLKIVIMPVAFCSITLMIF